MKVILKEDVDNLGFIGEIVTVKDGYARNYLLPRNLAVVASTKNIKELEHHKRIIQQKVIKAKNAAEEMAKKISANPVVIKAKAGEEEKLFGSVTNINIVEALKEMGFDINRKKILLDEPIKRLGEYNIKVKLHPEVSADLTVQVVKEEQVQG
jgi:large subunit ribosomal protein L9